MQFWYILAVALVKLSILCLYGRLFSATRYPRIITIFLFLTSAWLVSFIFATFFQVWPLRCNWVTCIPTTNYTVMYVCCSVTDVLLDIVILCIPSSFIRTLHISRSQKIGLIGIFGLGVLYVPALNLSPLSLRTNTQRQLHRSLNCTSVICGQICASKYRRQLRSQLCRYVSPRQKSLCHAEDNRTGCQHDYVVRHRSLRL